MEENKILNGIMQELRPAVEQLQAEALEFTLKRQGPKIVINLLVDKKGGINIDECALLNHRIKDIVDRGALLNERYLIQVSSPGLDRTLKTKRDFKRVIGQEVNILVLNPMKGKISLTGIVKIAQENELILTDEQAKEIVIPYSQICKAQLKIKF